MSETSSPSPNKVKREVVTFDFRSATDSSVASTGSYADDVTVPEVKWNMMERSSPDTPYPGSGLPSATDWWSTDFVTYPSPDPGLSSRKMKPEMVTSEFQSAAMKDWSNEANHSLVPDARSFGNYADGASDMMGSFSPDTSYPISKSPRQVGVAECWSTGFITYPSPDPVAETESTPGYRKPFCINSEWLAPGAREASPHDQWLEASYSTTNEDIWSYQIYNGADKLNNSHCYSQQHTFGSFPDQSISGVIYESLEGASDVCWPFDNDYIDDVLTVMAKAANNSHSIHGLA